ncbi:hypothetical protein PV08_10651 [Exophiala spinifera]|uniref:BTB domain-containing protein n=1 Tax=Exophiala spinifera TaxID=91928 RepID=A0A0D1Y8N0_9EURO|nr:uncharacterized protein PV08_10651 [Exophiala spinifera]KIW11351.1 hypothetical protein PV08_10651 [Exophiala spinifera]
MALNRKKSISFPTETVTLKFVELSAVDGSAKKISINNFIVHRDILYQSQWFARQPTTEEDGPVLICHERKGVGEQLINWLYFNNLPYSYADLAKVGDEGIRIGTEIVNAYCFAVKVELEDWANALLDSFCSVALEDMPWIKYLHALQSVQSSDEGLRALIMRVLASSIRETGWDRYIQEVNHELSQMVRDGGEFAENLVRCLADPETATKLPLQQKKAKCKWHIHRMTKKC